MNSIQKQILQQVEPNENIVAIICVVCQKTLFAEKNSDCHIYNRCTRCCDNFDRKVKRDS